MYSRSDAKVEMGGYLPLELPEGNGFFADLDPSLVLEVNTGRTALCCAVESMEIQRILLPYYYCPDVVAALKSMGLALEFYHLGPDLLPLSIHDAPGTALLLVDYFGVMPEKVRAYSAQFQKVILDQAHGFFVPPILREGVMNVYSCRKFFGVCDGAYLIGQGIRRPQLREDFSYQRAIHLFKSIEVGTNGAYAENKANEAALEERLAMSKLTRRILAGINYAAVAEKRSRNFRFLHQRLSHLQQLKLDENQVVPYTYPLLLERDIHAELVKEKIYVPVLWGQLLSSEWKNTWEGHLASDLVPLPLDQRYGEAEMDHLADVIERILAG